MPSAPRSGRAEREFSAGGVVVRDGPGGPECIVIVPTRRAANGTTVLALPKGHPEPGETPQEAALREVREETGVVAGDPQDLGAVSYWYQREGRRIRKEVTFFLFAHVSGDPETHSDFEVERATWMPLEQAAQQLSYDGERRMAALALSHLAPDR